MSFDEIRDEGKALSGEFIQAGDARQAQAGPTPDEAAAQVEREAREWAGFPMLFGGIVCQAMPELSGAYSENNCLEWGRRMVPVARKYGWTIGAFGDLAGLAAATWTFAKPTYDAVRARRAAAQKAAPKPSAPAPDGKPQETKPEGAAVQ